MAAASRRPRSLRAGVPAMVLIVISTACGKKGPPLVPFVRVPAAVTAVTPLRVADDVYVSFAVPETNADGQKPADIAEVEVYAVTSAVAPATEEQREVATLIATLPVRPIMPAAPDPPADAPISAEPPPPIPLPPGVDRGAAVAVREALTPETRVAVELPVDKKAPKIPEPLEPEEPFGPLVAPPPTQLPRRHYFVISKSPRGRESLPSTPVSIPLEAGSSAPGPPVVTHDAVEMTIKWTPPPDARTSTFLLPPTVKPKPAGANATPTNTTPKVPAPLAPLTAKSLGFNSVATRYHVYDVTPANVSPASPASPDSPASPVSPDPFALKPPAALTPAPITDTEFALKGVAFEVERCFEVRSVDDVFGATVIGPASPRVCVTPKDTFPPVAPKSLAAIAGAGVINLIWDANTENDLAGYLVLRGEAPGATLQPITPEPIAQPSYRDETVRAGTRYVYVVVAVDRAKNSSPQSNRAEETARQ
jgi:hypothetical protein